MALLKRVEDAVAAGVTSPEAIAKKIGERPARVKAALAVLRKTKKPAAPKTEPEE